MSTATATLTKSASHASPAPIVSPMATLAPEKCKCGAMIEHKFCGACGAKRRVVDPLSDLAAYLAKQVAKYQEIVDNPPTEKKGKAKGDPLTAEESAKAVARATKDRDKYQSWAKALSATQLREVGYSGVSDDSASVNDSVADSDSDSDSDSDDGGDDTDADV